MVVRRVIVDIGRGTFSVEVSLVLGRFDLDEVRVIRPALFVNSLRYRGLQCWLRCDFARQASLLTTKRQRQRVSPIASYFDVLIL